MGQKNTRHELVESRPFHLEKDYDMIKKWWSNHNSFAPTPKHMSETGIVIEVNNSPVCAGWVYKTDSKICVFEFVICDPEKDKHTRNIALSKLIKSVKTWSLDNGFDLIYSSIGISSYIKRLVSEGFIITDKHQTHVFYKFED